METGIMEKCPLFRGLGIVEINKVLNEVQKKIRKVRAGKVAAVAGETVSALIIIASGKVKGEMVDYSGHVIKIEDIPSPGLLAPAFIFGSRNNFPVNVVAVSDSELLIIDKPDFMKLLRKNEIILANFLNLISDRSQFLSEKIKFLSFKTIRGKLAQLILQKAGDSRKAIDLDMTQNELADFFGVARPSVARALGEMEEDGALNVKAGQITILNRKKLVDYMN
jgi:CRP/FNR family transcriptional regulator, dissimilatory nitrate respiration regulator